MSTISLRLNEKDDMLIRKYAELHQMDLSAFILSFIEEKLVNSEDPRAFGKSLQGNFKDKWRYRVGDYRILAKIEDEKVVIINVEIGHRRDIY